MVKLKIARTIGRNNYSVIAGNKNSQKVCFFSSVLMISLFITNSGDIVSELVGETV